MSLEDIVRSPPKLGSGLRLIRAVALAIVILYLAGMLAITVDGLTDSVEDVDVLVVLGNEVHATGEPSERLAARLDRAWMLYAEGVAPNIIVSGGIGKSGFDEAQVMERYLGDAGVPEEAIIVDSAGVNTRATAVNTKVIMARHDWRTALVVSQFFHIPRSRLAFQQEGIAPPASAHAEYFELRDLFSTAREVPAFATYLLD